MIDFADALRLTLDSVCQLGRIRVPLQKSLGRVLAQDIISQENIPPWDNSAMDGYAVRAQDIVNSPAVLRLAGEIPAGFAPVKALEEGEAMSIMTGAKIPAGASAVVQKEWTEQPGGSHIRILRTVPEGHNIRRVGTDIGKGALVLPGGRKIRAQEIGVLASLGENNVDVYRVPSACVIATGDELVGLRDEANEAQIRDSCSHLILALLEQAGCDATYLGIVPDRREDIRAKILEGLEADVLVTSGGVSEGKYDLVPDVLRELGVEIKFWKVNIKPGMPLLFGTYGNHAVFSLPGNPVSAVVTFLKFVRPAVLKMMGNDRGEQIKIYAQLDHGIEKTDGKRHFLRGIAESRNQELFVRATTSQVSNVLTSVTKANCLIILPEKEHNFRTGEKVEIELLE